MNPNCLENGDSVTLYIMENRHSNTHMEYSEINYTQNRSWILWLKSRWVSIWRREMQTAGYTCDIIQRIYKWYCCTLDFHIKKEKKTSTLRLFRSIYNSKSTQRKSILYIMYTERKAVADALFHPRSRKLGEKEGATRRSWRDKVCAKEENILIKRRRLCAHRKVRDTLSIVLPLR